MARRKQGEAGATRDAVLDAAESGFRLRGGAHASVESIAAQAGWSRGAASYHFRGKAELLRAVLARGACRCCRTCGVSRWRRDPSFPRCWLARSAGWMRCRETRMPGTSSASWPGPMTMRMTTRAYAARRWPGTARVPPAARVAAAGRGGGRTAPGPGRPRVRPAAGRLVAGSGRQLRGDALPQRRGRQAAVRAFAAGAACADRTAGPGRRRAPPANGAGAGRRKPVETYLLWRRQGGARHGVALTCCSSPQATC